MSFEGLVYDVVLRYPSFEENLTRYLRDTVCIMSSGIIGILVAITFKNLEDKEMKEAMAGKISRRKRGIAGEGYEVKSTVVKKNNGVELDAVIRKAGENVAPTICPERINH